MPRKILYKSSPSSSPLLLLYIQKNLSSLLRKQKTHLIIQIQILETRHGLGELGQLRNRFHRRALAAAEEPGLRLPLLELPAHYLAALRLGAVAVHHVGRQGPLSQLERLHVVDDEGLLGQRTRGQRWWWWWCWSKERSLDLVLYERNCYRL